MTFSSLVKHEANRFRLLSEGGDYFLHKETGYLSFATAINEQDIIAHTERKMTLPMSMMI